MTAMKGQHAVRQLTAPAPEASRHIAFSWRRRKPPVRDRGILSRLACAGVVGALAAAAIGAAPRAEAAAPGEKAFQENCGRCHPLPDPQKLTSEQWVVRLETMAPMARLNKEEKTRVLGFLQEHSAKAVQVVSMAQERKIFEEKCSLCHTPDRIFVEPLTPESRRHIVLRMRERAPAGWISEKEAHEILEYLEHGAPEAKKPVRKEAKGGPAEVFRERCSACHTLERVYLELEESKEKGKAAPWMHIVKRMREKAPEWITEKEAEQILSYLRTLRPVEKNESKP